MEQELIKEKNDKINSEQKMKIKLKEYKNKTNYLTKENNALKNILQQYRNNTLINAHKNNNIRNAYNFSTIGNPYQVNNLLNVDNYLNKTMLYNYDTNNALNGDEVSPNNNILNDVNLTYQNNSINPIKNMKKMSHTTIKNNFLEENRSQISHNRTINEFKDLLKKIDEKLNSEKKE